MDKFKFRHFMILVIVSTGLLVSGFAFVFFEYKDKQKYFKELNLKSDDVFMSIREEISKAEKNLISVKSLYMSSKYVNKDDFLQLYYSIKGKAIENFSALAWLPRVNGNDKEKFEDIGRQKYKDFFIKEVDGVGLYIPVDKKELYFPVLHIAPEKGNEHYMGLDFFSLDRYRKHIQLSINEDTIIASEKINNINLNNSQSKEIFMFLALNKKLNNKLETKGIIMGVLNVYQFILYSLKKVGEQELKVKVVDLSDVNEKSKILFGYDVNDKFLDFAKKKELKIGNRVWEVTCYIDFKLPVSIQSWLVMILGLFITASIVFYVLYIEKLVEERTKELKFANDAKAAFLSNMSYEIRNPLTTIMGYTEVIKEEISNANNDVSTNLYMINRIYKNSHYLLKVLTDILDLSKLDANKLNINKNKIRLLELINELSSEISERAKDKGLVFDVDFVYPLPKIINLDKNRLVQILNNLLVNAIKATQNGYIQLVVRYDSITELMKFDISDTGRGVPEEIKNKIFEPFYNASESMLGKNYGVGLELCISKKLCNQMDGDLYLKSKEGQGSVYSVVLPANLEENTEFVFTEDDIKIELKDILKKSQIDYKKLEGFVLLVEDLQDNQKLIIWYLNKFGLNYKLVEDGKEAVKFACNNDYIDLILMDIKLPILDGFDAMKQIRKSGFDKPIIVLTANSSESDVKVYLSNGFDGYLSKPITKQSFYKEIAKGLGYLDENNFSEGVNMTENTSFDIDDDDDFENSEEFKQIKKIFIEGLPEDIDNMKKASEQDDKSDLMRFSHNMKSSGRTFHYDELGDLAEKVEHLIKDKKIDDALNTLPSLLEKMEEVYNKEKE